MRIVVSYSGGKDSVLALGPQPVGLLVMMNSTVGRSWFHGAQETLLQEIARSLGLPLFLCPCEGQAYHTAMEQGLKRAKQLGAEGCVFGDMDIEEHAQWCRQRCDSVGLQALFPLWGRTRQQNVQDLLDLGYRCVIKCVQNACLPQSFLGKILDTSLVEELEALGVDLCGENGEYHTLAVDGPLFTFPVGYRCGEILDLGNISVVDLILSVP